MTTTTEGVFAVMDATQVQQYARQLFEEQGTKAIAAAAEKAVRLERSGDAAQAHAWRRIEAALMLMRGPRET
jgi:hypothetical protein